jgi:GWxTD domain-containing protein
MPVGLLTGLPAAQIESILLHELAHIRRHDYLVNLIQTAVESVFFYHPAVWWINHVIRTEREHCCDDLAVALTGDPHEYAAALAALEKRRWHASQAALAATRGSLVKRIRRLLVPTALPRFAATPFFIGGILTIVLAGGLVAWQATVPKPEEKTSPYTKWLEEDVGYIIEPQERIAYLALQTDAEREHFIEQFWLRRDPTPDTPENEFQGEHYRRIGYSNLHFATAQGTAGWRTDRGRIYIVFGPPDELDAHPKGDAGRGIPYETWRYRYIEGIGYDVLMQFVDPSGNGDFQMTRDPNEKDQFRRPAPN